MRVVLRRMESLGGLQVATDENVELERITIGRGTDQDVQLPDVRITLAHAEIRPQQRTGFRLQCLSENPVLINGRPVQERVLRGGDEIDCGRFRLTVMPVEPGADLVLQIEERVTAREEKGRRRKKYQLALPETTLRKRQLAWALALAVLVPLLVLPFMLRFASGHTTGASLDAAWQAGPASAAHASFVRDCAACHEKPFAAVRNEACQACHKDQPHHSDRPEILGLDRMGDANCAACHQEHTGRDALIARNTALCTDCHANPDKHYAAAKLPPVSRFDGDHPGFTLTLPAWDDKGELKHVKVAQEPGPVKEITHLAFPHDVHLVPDGVSSPDGKKVMVCADCHRPMATGFAPIRMEEHCRSCHTLDLDPDEPGRHLPHRAPREVASLILDHYARVALAGGVEEPSAPSVVRLLRRPGQVMAPDEREAAMTWAEAKAAAAMEDVFSRRVCAECHNVKRTSDIGMPWNVEPVALSASFLTGARFDHAAHRTESCSRCHDAEHSKSSGDVLTPTIANCRECHSDNSSHGRVGTACVDCHGFHIAEKAHFGAAVETK